MSVERMPEPTENDNTDCYLQETAIGTLKCKVTGKAVKKAICFNCAIGKVYREKGCRKVSGQIRVVEADQGDIYLLEQMSMFCAVLKDEVSLDYCRNCKRKKPAEPISY